MKEYRSILVSGLRSDTEADGKVYLTGYAARYNVLSRDLGWFESVFERIKPGAFTRAILEKQDVYHLVNHDPSQILGRTLSGTTVLVEDENGLRFRTLINPSDPDAVAVAARVARGDLNQCSFGFEAREVSWTEQKEADGITTIRELIDLDLFDISTVTFPAYPNTSTSIASMRSLLRADGSKVPLTLRARIDAKIEKRDPEDQELICGCDCMACYDGECEDCMDDDCHDPGCRCWMRSHGKRGDKLTKKVDGEDLTSDCFLIVGDEEDTSSWKLPVKFSSDEKSKSHIRNALARFNQLKGVSEEAKKAAWSKLVKLAKEHGIDVSDDETKSVKAGGRRELSIAQYQDLTFDGEAETRKAYLEAYALSVFTLPVPPIIP